MSFFYQKCQARSLNISAWTVASGTRSASLNVMLGYNVADSGRGSDNRIIRLDHSYQNPGSVVVFPGPEQNFMVFDNSAVAKFASNVAIHSKIIYASCCKRYFAAETFGIM